MTLISLNPKCVGLVIDDLVRSDGPQIHNFAFHRRACGVRAKIINLNTNAARLSMQDALINEIYLDHTPVDRADDTEGCRRNFASRVTEQQKQDHEQERRETGEKDVQILQGQETYDGSQQQEGNTLARNKRISSSFHDNALSQTAATITCFVIGVNTATSHKPQIRQFML